MPSSQTYLVLAKYDNGMLNFRQRHRTSWQLTGAPATAEPPANRR